MCSYLPLTSTLGGAKVYIEAAESYKKLGHNVFLIGIDEIVGKDKPVLDEEWRVLNFPEKLKEYILKNAHQYDVIEFESLFLPYPMKEYVNCLMVARSVILHLHLKEIKIPYFFGIKSFFGRILKGPQRRAMLEKKIHQCLLGMKHADLVNVANPSDKKILIKYRIPEEKIIIHPYGISQAKLDEFTKAKIQNTKDGKRKIIAFVGTFDNRKGAVEFPKIIRQLLTTHSDLEFKLLGVFGMFSNEESIHQYLGIEFKERIHIYGKYKPEDLPILLSDCSFGVFPSYLESFGFGVLEMMAMDLPVVGYDSPGINMLLINDLIVKPGNIQHLIGLLNRLILEDKFKEECILKCRHKVNEFIYEKQKNISIEVYQEKLKANNIC